MKKNWMILSLMALVYSLTSCLNFDEGENYQRFGAEQVVVEKQNEETYLRTLRGILKAPELKDRKHGECLLAAYTVYFNTAELQASDIEVAEEVVLNPVISLSELFIEKGYTDTINDFIPFDYNFYLDGKVFFGIQTTGAKNAIMAFNLTLVPKAESSASNEFNAYLTAKRVAEGTGTAALRADYQVFDFKQFIIENGLETTNNNYAVQTVKINFFYLSGFKDDKPEWKQNANVTKAIEYNLLK
ncbi:MAG: hypothetical protein LBG77_04430 [Dysgonamonadaceae bacterium]|nr:hypothetical protein [Dysgonamonadaceae bacterium]